MVAVDRCTGNVLVCVAVKVERKLHNVTNYFLVSLAFADLLVSLVVMPCSILQEMNGQQPRILHVSDDVVDAQTCALGVIACRAGERNCYFLPRDASAERGDATISRLSVRPSVRPSVCL